MKYLLFFLMFGSAQACVTGPYVYYADVKSVYDGDTITVDVLLGFHTSRNNEKLRLYGIDAPEMRGSSKLKGTASRDWLRSRISGKRITIQTIKDKRGKYGRYLAVIFDKNCVNLNDELVKQGMAVYREY